jgi:hypothetical protein
MSKLGLAARTKLKGFLLRFTRYKNQTEWDRHRKRKGWRMKGVKITSFSCIGKEWCRSGFSSCFCLEKRTKRKVLLVFTPTILVNKGVNSRNILITSILIEVVVDKILMAVRMKQRTSQEQYNWWLHVMQTLNRHITTDALVYFILARSLELLTQTTLVNSPLECRWCTPFVIWIN